jgi:hypothetical protein
LDLNELLLTYESEILAEASFGLERSHLTHYAQAGMTAAYDRLKQLFALVAQSVRDRNLTSVIDYIVGIAEERFTAGYDLREVQTAINVLEEAIWKQIVERIPPKELAMSLGLVSTVLGVAKDSLARTYVSLASEQRVSSLNLLALFEGTAGV